ncbi:acylphosphatase-like isoform X1 [Lycorma delicatula]|uniref:acylphosphatase-like isoform X1 n=1 Tax=Lycorma delicatula TaxID=130591 RepID=UPI003F510413
MWYRVTFYLILIYHTFSYSYHPKNSTTEKIWPDDTSNLLAVDFEIEGVVQGVNFREFTREKAKLLDLRGFVTNTKNGTVLGHLEGNADDVKHMGSWLKENTKNYTLTVLENEKLKEYNYKNKTLQTFLLTIIDPRPFTTEAGEKK